MFANHDETLREREMWEKFEMDGFGHTDSLFDSDGPDEDKTIDAALQYFQAINLGTVGPTDSNSFYDDGDETITNTMRDIGNIAQCPSSLAVLRMVVGPDDDDMKQAFWASTNASSSTQAHPEWFPYPSKMVWKFLNDTPIFVLSVSCLRCFCWMHLTAFHGFKSLMH